MMHRLILNKLQTLCKSRSQSMSNPRVWARLGEGVGLGAAVGAKAGAEAGAGVGTRKVGWINNW